jgi:hypothetical protein
MGKYEKVLELRLKEYERMYTQRVISLEAYEKLVSHTVAQYRGWKENEKGEVNA